MATQMPTPAYAQALFPVTFVAGPVGPWQIESVTAVVGSPLPAADRLSVHPEHLAPGVEGALWQLRGTASHARYVEQAEQQVLTGRSPALGRAEDLCAALIPIRKSAAWWALAQDARRAIFEGQSRHIADSLPYLPRIARRLYHSRDLGEPFDFLTWFEFAPEHTAAFDELVAMLRSRPEWQYVEREVDIRLRRKG